MYGGFDQYLANQFTRQGVFEVVVDPALADAVVTGQLGKTLEEKLTELYPAPEPEAAAEKQQEESAEADQKEYQAFQQGSSFARGRGNVFLVDPRAKSVIWSTHLTPKSSAVRDQDRAAGRVAKQVRETIKKLTGGR